jgi:hypothetical protein
MSVLPAVLTDEDGQIPLRASIGVAWATTNTLDVDELVARADEAMYISKREASDSAAVILLIVLEVALTQEARLMKTMTCKQLGGPCDLPLHGNTADEVIKGQDKHLKEMVAGGDGTHEGALKAMKGRWKHPISGMGWYRNTKRDFAALSED